MRIFGLILVSAIQISCEDVKEIQHCLEIDYQFDTEIAYEFPSSDKIVVKSYYPDGILYDSATLNNCTKVGLRKMYFKEDEYTRYFHFENDTLNGLDSCVSDDGIVLANGLNLNGVKIKEWIWKNKDGSLLRYEYFDLKGERMYKVNYETKGKPVITGHPIALLAFVSNKVVIDSLVDNGEIDIISWLATPPNSNCRMFICEVNRVTGLFDGNPDLFKQYTIKSRKGEPWILKYHFKQKGNVDLLFQYYIKNLENGKEEKATLIKKFYVNNGDVHQGSDTTINLR